MKKVKCFLAILSTLLLCFSTGFAEKWTCSTCGRENEGNYCPACGSKKPETWLCENCYTFNTMNFCEKCGSEKGNLIVDVVYRMDGSSMNDSIMDGDAVLIQSISALDYRLSDIIACNFPGRGDLVFIKRLVGMPGDRVSIQDGYLYVNGTKYEEAYINDGYRVAGGSNGQTFSEVYIPKKGDILSLDYLDEAQTRVGMTVNGEVWGWRGICSDGVSDSGDRLSYSHGGVLSLNGKDISGDADAIRELVGKEFKIEKDLYFVMGDHRNNSNDSRAQGPLSEEYLLGVKVAVLRFNSDYTDYQVVQ